MRSLLNKHILIRIGLAWCVLCFAVSVGCVPEKRAVDEGFLTVSVEQKASWTRNFNPLVATAGARWPSQGGVYESLMIFNFMKSQWVPWLATAHEWSEDNQRLFFKIREDVLWSDGTPFSAQDVLFTFELLKKFPALDSGGVWQFLKSVSLHVDGNVVFDFKKKYVPGLHTLAHQPIVPQHIWSLLDDPVAFSNPEPIATGPFTEVLQFENQIYVLGRNKHYWNKEKI